MDTRTDDPTIAVLLMTISLLFVGFSYAGWNNTPLDICPTYTGNIKYRN